MNKCLFYYHISLCLCTLHMCVNSPLFFTYAVSFFHSSKVHSRIPLNAFVCAEKQFEKIKQQWWSTTFEHLNRQLQHLLVHRDDGSSISSQHMLTVFHCYNSNSYSNEPIEFKLNQRKISILCLHLETVSSWLRFSSVQFITVGNFNRFFCGTKVNWIHWKFKQYAFSGVYWV